jgi:hypothetical protein
MIKNWIPLAQVHSNSSRELRNDAAQGKTDYEKHPCGGATVRSYFFSLLRLLARRSTDLLFVFLVNPSFGCPPNVKHPPPSQGYP